LSCQTHIRPWKLECCRRTHLHDTAQWLADQEVQQGEERMRNSINNSAITKILVSGHQGFGTSCNGSLHGLSADKQSGPQLRLQYSLSSFHQYHTTSRGRGLVQVDVSRQWSCQSARQCFVKFECITSCTTLH